MDHFLAAAPQEREKELREHVERCCGCWRSQSSKAGVFPVRVNRACPSETGGGRWNRLLARRKNSANKVTKA